MKPAPKIHSTNSPGKSTRPLRACCCGAGCAPRVCPGRARTAPRTGDHQPDDQHEEEDADPVGSRSRGSRPSRPVEAGSRNQSKPEVASEAVEVRQLGSNIVSGEPQRVPVGLVRVLFVGPRRLSDASVRRRVFVGGRVGVGLRRSQYGTRPDRQRRSVTPAPRLMIRRATGA